MKKIVLMVAVVACVAFASQGVQASTVQVSVENVMQDDFVKIEVKELPQAVQDAIAKSYEGSTVQRHRFCWHDRTMYDPTDDVCADRKFEYRLGQRL